MKFLGQPPVWLSRMTRSALAIALALTFLGCGDDRSAALTLATQGASQSAGQSAVGVTAQVAGPSRQLAQGATLETLGEIGLVRPVAALYDPMADVYLVSNAGRAGYRGFISSVLPDGSTDNVRWVDGAAKGVTLYSPASMAFVQNRLVVADGDHLRVFDRETGAPRGAVHIAGALALQDVAAGVRGDVYVTDSGRGHLGAVYRVGRRGTVSVVAKSSVLGRPTGIVVVDSVAWIAAIDPEAFYGVARNGHLTHGAVLPGLGATSGLTRAGDQLFFSSPESRVVYGGPLQGPFEPVVMDIDSPGDVGWDPARRRLLVPRTNDDSLELHTLPGPPA